jgi:hypothetical protein
MKLSTITKQLGKTVTIHRRCGRSYTILVITVKIWITPTIDSSRELLELIVAIVVDIVACMLQATPYDRYFPKKINLALNSFTSRHDKPRKVACSIAAVY